MQQSESSNASTRCMAALVLVLTLLSGCEDAPRAVAPGALPPCADQIDFNGRFQQMAVQVRATRQISGDDAILVVDLLEPTFIPDLVHDRGVRAECVPPLKQAVAAAEDLRTNFWSVMHAALVPLACQDLNDDSDSRDSVGVAGRQHAILMARKALRDKGVNWPVNCPRIDLLEWRPAPLLRMLGVPPRVRRP